MSCASFVKAAFVVLGGWKIQHNVGGFCRQLGNSEKRIYSCLFYKVYWFGIPRVYTFLERDGLLSAYAEDQYISSELHIHERITVY
jgi:hypothetical protein